jgi:hypothetical protein
MEEEKKFESIEMPSELMDRPVSSNTKNIPEFSKNTKVEISSVMCRVGTEIEQKPRKDGTMSEFKSFYFEVRYLFEDTEYLENWAGGRIYHPDDEAKTNYWTGPNSALGRAVEVIKGATGNDNPTVADIKKVLLGAKGVWLRTEELFGHKKNLLAHIEYGE